MNARTPCIFRVWRGKGGGDVIALFPDVAASISDPRLCQSYMHIGQHCAADYSHVIRVTRPATPAEYAPLRRELEGAIGYVLDIRQRWQRRRR